MTLWPYRPYYVLWQIYCIIWLFRYYFQIAILLDQPPTDQPSYGILTIQLAVLPTWLTAYGILISHSQFAVLPHQQTDRLWHFVPPNPNCHIFFCPAQICSPGCMAFHFQFLICCTSDHQLPADQQQTDWATAFQFQFSVCRTFFWPDQDLIPCPRLDFLLRHFIFNFQFAVPFSGQTKTWFPVPDLISCYGILFSILICHTLFWPDQDLIPCSQLWFPVMAFQFQFLNCRTLAQDSCSPFLWHCHTSFAVPSSQDTLICIFEQETSLWFWQVAVIQAKTILLEDWISTLHHYPCIWTVRIDPSKGLIS